MTNTPTRSALRFVTLPTDRIALLRREFRGGKTVEDVTGYDGSYMPAGDLLYAKFDNGRALHARLHFI